jgi:uncharacterized small protein (DUF1192 family)
MLTMVKHQSVNVIPFLTSSPKAGIAKRPRRGRRLLSDALELFAIQSLVYLRTRICGPPIRCDVLKIDEMFVYSVSAVDRTIGSENRITRSKASSDKRADSKARRLSTI